MVNRNSDNWEGDKNLDEYKGQDWRGAVFDGKYGYGGKYHGVGNYGGGYSGEGHNRGGRYSYSPRRRKNKKIILAILIPIFTVAALFYFVNPLDIALPLNLGANPNPPEETLDLQKQDAEQDGKEFADCQMRSNGNDLVEITCPKTETMYFLAKDPVKTSIQNGVTLVDIGDGDYIMSWRHNNGNLVSYDLTSLENPKSAPMPSAPGSPLDIGKEIIEKSQEAIESATEELSSTVQKGISQGGNSATSEPPAKTTAQAISKSELYKKALELVNEDRANNGLAPVKLSSNEAAQVHADDVLKTRTISHWMTNGEKPYMTYTRYGGAGYVGQNVASGGYEDVEQCNSWNVICDPIDPINAMENSEYDMMFNDAASSWGHRDNILDPRHTHVSFGIAYDQYYYAFVQNFEDNYIDLIRPIGDNLSDVRIIGNVIEGQLQNVAIYYDQYPTQQLYQVHKDDSSYGLGNLVAIVEEPLPPNYYYDEPSGYKLIVAKSMSQSGNTINIVFDMSSVATTRGVYTITVWLQSNGLDIPATSYALFVD